MVDAWRRSATALACAMALQGCATVAPETTAKRSAAPRIALALHWGGW